MSTKQKGVWITDAKLKELGACSLGRRAFRRFAKGRKRVLVTADAIQAYVDARPCEARDQWALWLRNALQIDGHFRRAVTGYETRREDGREVYYRNPNGQGGVYVDGTWLYFGRPDYFRYWDGSEQVTDNAESYDAAVRLARQRRAAQGAGGVSGQPTAS